ncbi:MAG: DNA helicase II [Legionellales bacterium RIFCSPHIGHO2_12_FULL_37_14]|nr:MAG: DNA helicase II [Legionellales bacterium RIFCSPHIGHO2_12_FULL_37_14]
MLEGLNEQQLKAVKAPLQNILVLAGAGSGKTKVLVSRIYHLITEHNFSLHAILAVTFTNKAAKEMKDRLHNMLNASNQNLWVGTFHSLCQRILRIHHQEAGLEANFQIIDSDDQAKIIKHLVKQKNLDIEKWPVKAHQSYINAQKEEGIRAKDIEPQAYGPTKIYHGIYVEYEKITKKQNLVDFAELILRCCELLRDNQALLQHYHTKFKVILVDEFQDTNSIQYALIRLIASPYASVMAVGDDDQSIYGWRGAKIENIKRFTEDFTDTELIRLEQNYRSTSTILHAANKLIENNQGRMGKSLWTKGALGSKIIIYPAFNEIEEANFVVSQIKNFQQQGESCASIACLYRSNAQSRVLEDAFIRAQVSYRIYAGVRFYDRAEIKDAMAYLRLCVNPNDDLAFMRVVNVPPRGIGEKCIAIIEEYASSANTSYWQALSTLLKDETQFTPRAKNSLQAFCDLVASFTLHAQEEESLENLLVNILNKSGLLAHYNKTKSELGTAKVDNLKEWVNAAKEFQAEAIKEDSESWATAFLAFIALESGESNENKDDTSSVHMMTIHAAKGLEFPIVFILGVEEGIFPSRLSLVDESKLQEERRLCYVAMTRAKKHLIISYAQVRRLYGKEERHRPSRFLAELPNSAIDERTGFTDSKTPKLKKTQQSNLPYPIGKKVIHPTFKEGVILAYEGSGVQMNVQVRFQSVGTKWLSLAYAKLSTTNETSP